MKQVLQHLGNGETMLAEVPRPRRGEGGLLIKSTRSLVSLGTERMLIEFGKGSLIAKARSQPDKVKQVLQKIQTDGLWTTIDAVRAKLDAPIPLGYCQVGYVADAGPESCYAIGQRVVSNGPHAEFVSVPNRLTAPIPDAVSDESASFTVIGAIALQGIRLIQPTLGERVVVMGLGLIGLLAVQILRANGCRVLGVDFSPTKLNLAREFGAETCDLSANQDPVAVTNEWTGGVGADAVLITASAKSDALVHQAATMCRQRGRIVLVGVVGLQLQRSDFYEKELTFQVSCSYGPGRYDPNYERRGLDYPIGFVRWTEQRNFEAILQLMEEGKLSVDRLISHRYAIDDALAAYETVTDPGAMGILLEYPESAETNWSEIVESTAQNAGSIGDRRVIPGAAEPVPVQNREKKTQVSIAFIGAGAFATRMLLPSLPKEHLRRRLVVSGSGVSATHACEKFGFEEAATDTCVAMEDPLVDAVFIATPHHLHATMVRNALEAGKDVFVEKPLALNKQDLDEIEVVLRRNPSSRLMIGFNRRFSPHSQAIKQWMLASSSSHAIVITVNAGAIPQIHWTQDPNIGGGRIVGEACHFIDLARFFVGHPIRDYSILPMEGVEGRLGDCVSMHLSFTDGSIATVHYYANGSKKYPKERVEVFSGGRVLVCDNFRSSREFGGKRKLRTRKQDKGHVAEVAAFLDAVRSGETTPISWEEMIEVSRVSIEMQNLVQMRAGKSLTRKDDASSTPSFSKPATDVEREDYAARS